MMELACHLRNIQQIDSIDRIPEHLNRFYGKKDVEAPPWAVLPSCTRIYLGDEFCFSRMPSPLEVERFASVVLERGFALTLLTPVMTDGEMDKAEPLFGWLNENQPGTEVVVNDWGVMSFLKRSCPSLALSSGRILDKGFKDPRLKLPPDVPDDTDMEDDPLLNHSTYDGSWIREKLSTTNIRRLERDLFPYRNHVTASDDKFKISFYFPFGYVTSGRTCWLASFDQPRNRRFVPPENCSQPCRKMVLELKDSSFVFRIFQLGNTIFYLYPPERLSILIHDVAERNQRLIYQGFGFDAS